MGRRLLSSLTSPRQHSLQLLSRCCQTVLKSWKIRQQKEMRKNIMSNSKDLTGNTPPSSSAENIAAKVQPSALSASSDNTPTSTQTSRNPSEATLTTGENALTTLQISEKSRQHAMLVRAILSQLAKAGLIKRFKVLSKDGTTVQRIRVEFDMSLWTEDLELK